MASFHKRLSLKTSWTWKEGLKFALAENFLTQDESILTYTKNRAEYFGAFCVKPLYYTLDCVSKKIKKPMAIFLFTLLALFCVILIFYNIPALIFLGKLFPSKTVRFLLFIYVEISLFSLGCRAVGRFNNKALIQLWKEGKLIPIFPGDQKA
jgi:hypothetical protein